MNNKFIRKKRIFGCIVIVMLLTLGIIAAFNKWQSENKLENGQPKIVYTEDQKQQFINNVTKEVIPSTTVTTTNPETVHIDEIEFSAWIPYWDTQRSIDSIKQNPQFFRSVSPTWYFLKSDGTLGTNNTARSTNLIAACSQNSIKLIPTISNSSADELSAILNNDDLLEKHINNILNEVIIYNYDGIDIDYEHILSKDRDKFSQFFSLLSNKLHENGKILTTAILWKVEPEELINSMSESRKAQDWTAISDSVDELRVMAYEYTSSGDKAGPITPLFWYNQIISYSLDKVPLDKLSIALPLYAYEWSEGKNSAKAYVWTDIEAIKLNNSIISDKMDESYMEKQLIYKKGTETKIIYYQDSEVTFARIEKAKENGIYKFVFWRLGGEDKQIYSNQ